MRYHYSSSFLGVVLTARVAFSKRSWPYLAAIAVPWLLCAGQRCVTRLADLAAHPRSLSGYYRFLSDGKWRLTLFWRALFEVIVRTFPTPTLTLVLDDTLVPKWGRHIFGTGTYFDHVARPRPGYIWGHNWVVLAVVVGLGPTASVALPFWVRLYRRKGDCRPGEFRTRHELAQEALDAVRSWYAGAILLLADGAYNVASLVTPARALEIHLVSRLRSNAVLRDLEVPGRRPGRPGRPRKWGHRLGSLPGLARVPGAFTPAEVALYGRRVTLRLREFAAYSPALGRAIKVVITRDPTRPTRVAYLMSTDVTLPAVALVEAYARRWTVEQLFAVAKTHLGFDSAEVRKPRAVARHAALTLALITWTEVWWRRVRPQAQVRSFATKLGALRTHAITEAIFASGPRTRRARRNAEALAGLFRTATSAA